jgi:uncharacterized protein YdeI (YjbR/CyaY-like superfamily)
MLLRENRMTPAGLKIIKQAKESGQWHAIDSSREAIAIPNDLKMALSKNKEAEKKFNEFPPSSQFMYIHWINEEKKNDTRARRIHTIVVRSEKGKKPGIDLRVIDSRRY